MEVKQELIELRKELFDFSRRNPFVDVRVNKLWIEGDSENVSLPQKLYKKARFYWNEYGLETSLEVYAFIQWLPPADSGKASNLITSPLLYRPVKIKRTRKIDTIYEATIQSEVYYINPVLRHYFKLFFDFDLPIEAEDRSEILELVRNFFNTESSRIETKYDFNDEDGWQLIEKKAIGIFNYKKSALGADYDIIIEHPNEQVKRLLTGDSKRDNDKGIIGCRSISILDYSQKNVVNKALNENVVIQGPPGTGKSHTIVALIGAFLLEKKKVLFVSEKRSALDVVYDRLGKKGLGNLVAYFNTDKDQKKEFYAHLKSAWEGVERYVPKGNEAMTKRDKGIFELYPARLLETDKDAGVNLSELIEVLLHEEKQINNLGALGKVPTFGLWQKNMTFLQRFEKIIQEAFNVKRIAGADVALLNSVVFSESEVLLVLEKRLNNMELVLEKINDLQTRYKLEVSLDGFIKLALTGSILNMVDKVQIDLLNTDSKKYKSFNNWAKKYQLVKTKLKQAELGNKKWTQKPSISEITELMDLLQMSNRQQGSSVLRLLRRNPAKLKTTFKDFHPGIGVHTKIKLLEAVQLEWRLKGELEEIRVKLRHNLNITDPEHEIDLIFNLRNKLNALSQNEYIQILEHENSAELILALSQVHPEIMQFNAQNRFLFRKHEVISTHKLAMRLAALKAQLPLVNHWLPELKKYYGLPVEVRSFVQDNEHSVDHLNAVVAYQNLLEATRFEPNFKNLTGWNIIEEAKKQRSEKQLECDANITEIVDNIYTEHAAAESLISRPNFKLNEAEKAGRKRYKKEKRTILHEVNKQQRHLPVKGFFEATQEHLLKIQPVWMMNPLTVSENLPCIADIFDVIIFDESSQIPLEDSIPGIYRAKQAVVVGDSMQMPPSAFFTSKEETKTVLDQGEQVFSNQMLKWHYRSNHPDLIQFSNQEFYRNELVTFPPQFTENPIEVKLTQGNYDAGKNEMEAEAIATYCKDLSINRRKNTLIIAFSQEQEKEIRRQLGKVGFDMSTENDTIRTRNLENAQGIESDLVIVSMGYGKNQKGDFRLNFGPVNQINGANRLNVLFTRAIEKMVVFTSVRSSDFGLSDNKGVAVLRDFLAFAETTDRNKSFGEKDNLAHERVKEILEEIKVDLAYYPVGSGIGFDSFIDHKKNRIVLVDPGIEGNQMDSHLSADISDLLTVLLEYYQGVKVILSLDLWQNTERVKTDLMEFLK